LERRKKAASDLAKWLGSLGKYGEPPDSYFIHAASKELGMSYAELESHDERERLMTIAFTLSHGRDEGEHMMQCNPEFIKMQKVRSQQQSKAQKRG
jgi:hypothetical protein